MLTGLLGFSLLSTSSKCPYHLLVLPSLSLSLVLYCGTVRWSLVTQYLSPGIVSSCAVAE